MTAAFHNEITEVLSQSFTYINTIDTDELAEALIPRDVPIRNLRGVKTTGDGNCLFYSVSLALSDCNNGIRPLLNGNISPRTDSVIYKTVHILWSRDGNLDDTPKAAYHPNLFVYLHLIYDNATDEIELEDQSDIKKQDEVEQPPLKKLKTFQVKIDAWFRKKITLKENDAQEEKKEHFGTQEETKRTF
ncbi:unnamed protein product [Mytilus coruscus]|uniref:OTU domain-containing protein n=1 Tax=Mytilus coruscus TaxID=42192 RepID=A0A6J8EVV9_MYTCO|nr:unnamed protein product [Mytilus coruscus]